MAAAVAIARVSKESIFSDLNNMEIVTATSDKYAASFGFTEPEVFAALDGYGLADKKEEVKSWYDGFTFGNKKDIYNPWSILNFLNKGKLAAYWANTSSNSLVSKLIREGSSDIKRDFERLMQGESLNLPLDEQIVYSQLAVSDNAVWSLLLASGYLKVDETVWDELDGREYYCLRLTNREVQFMFRNMVRGWFEGDSSRCTQADYG